VVRQDKSKPGRVTPKGTVPHNQAKVSAFAAESEGHRVVTEDQRSSIIVPIIMFGTFLIGSLMILLNYLELIGDPSNWYLLGGLGLILVGIILATQYR